MVAIRTPRSVKSAQTLCERFAEIEDSIGLAESERNAAIAKANAAADALIEPLIAERGRITERLKPWWLDAGAELTEGKRKTIELGGCVIGTVQGRPSLDVPVKQLADDAKTVLSGTKWGKALLRTTVSFDKRAIAKAMEGANAPKLAQLGFTSVAAQDSFVLKRAEQQGTRG